MFNRIFVLLTLLIWSFTTLAQESQPIFIINGQTIYASDFMQARSSQLRNGDTTGLYRLMMEYATEKIQECEALNRRMDTTLYFRNAMEYHSQRLMMDHVKRNNSTKSLISKMLSQSKYQYNVAYIRIDIYSNSHGDTSAAYSKAIRAINRIERGANFETVALQMSDAPDTKNNGGYLGWVSPIDFKMGHEATEYIYAHFGDGDNISRPIRSGNSYYVIKVGGRRNAISNVNISPILVRKTLLAKNNEAIKKNVNNIYQQLKKGDNFDSIQYQHSDIKFSQQMSVNEAYSKYSTHILDNIENNSITKIIETNNYFLICRINNTTPLLIDDNYRDNINNKFLSTDIFRTEYKNFLDSMRRNFKYKLVGNMQPIIRMMPDSAIFEAKFNPGNISYMTETLFILDNKNYSYADFLQYIIDTQYPTGYSKIPEYINWRFNEYLDLLELNLAKNYLLKSDNVFIKAMQESKNAVMLETLRLQPDYPKSKIDKNEIISFYYQEGYNYKTSYELWAAFYDYKNASTLKKKFNIIDQMSKDTNFVPTESSFNFLEKGNYQLGTSSLGDSLINGFDSGIYNDNSPIVYLNHVNTFAIVSVTKKPETFSDNEIVAVTTPKYLKIKHENYNKKLLKKHNIQILPNAYQILSDMTRQQ